MLKKKGGVIALLLLVILMYGCTTSTTSSGSVTGAYANCYGDETQMITAEFASFAPVSSQDAPYTAGEEIDIEVELTNKYTEDIETGNVKVRLTGEAAEDSIFTGAEEVTADTLYAIDSETCLEESREVEIGSIVYMGDTTTEISKEITGEYCYKQDIVVKGFLYFTDDSSEIGTTLPSGSNPPSSVQITQIEQNPVDVDRSTGEGDMRFKLYIENVGDGTIVESLDTCFDYREASYKEEFTLTTDGPYNLDCPDDVALNREDKSDVISCTVDGIDASNLGDSAFEVTFTFSDFAYVEEIPSTTIYIEP